MDISKVKTIGYGAFSACTALTSVDMPEVTSVGETTFRKCTALAEIKMPKLKAAAGDSFQGSAWHDGLTDEFAIVGDGVLVDYNGTDTDITLPDEVKYIAAFNSAMSITRLDANKAVAIGDKAISQCTMLAELVAPEVKTIGAGAVDNSGIAVLELPKVTSIGEYSLQYSKALKSVFIPKAIHLDNNVFYRCERLSTLNLMHVEKLGDSAFGMCSALTSVYFYSDEPVCGRSVFTKGNDDLHIYFASGTSGWTVPTWKGFASEQFTPDGYFLVSFTDNTKHIVFYNEYVEAGDIVDVMPTAPTYDGYTFMGWDYDNSPVTGALTITALYEEDEQTPPESEQPTPPVSGEPTQQPDRASMAT